MTTISTAPARLFSSLRNARTFVGRWRSILKYHRPEQLLRRVGYRLRDALPVQHAVDCSHPELHPAHVVFPDFSPARLQELADGQIRLLNVTRKVGHHIDWDLRRHYNVSPLWRFHLHYHEYLLDIADDAAGRPMVQEILGSWRRRFADDQDRIAWHPYCISRRLPVWAALLSRPGVIESERSDLIRCLASQAKWLSNRLERDIGGNHLWENARALVVAGCLFNGPSGRRWLSMGRSLLNQCMDEQLLPWDEHFERSPMYQADLARGLEEASQWIAPFDQHTSQSWTAAAVRMYQFLDDIRHPDGGIPLFGDSTLDLGNREQGTGNSRSKECSVFSVQCSVRQKDNTFSQGNNTVDVPEPPPPCSLAAPKHPNSKIPIRSGWVGEYYVHREGDHQLIFDAGNMGPDHLPAHAHADLLGFELSAYGKRLFVDSGVFSYSGSERSRFRESHAHNVCIVDDVPMADVWSSFRMGRRGHVVVRSSGQNEDGLWITAAHNAYQRIGVPLVRRIWFLTPGGPWFCVDVVSVADNREHQIQSLLHLAPDYKFESLDDATLRVTGGSDVVLEVLGEGIQWHSSRYSERFNQSVDNPCVGIRSRCSETGFVAWCLSFGQAPCRPKCRWTGHSLEIEWDQMRTRKATEVPIRE